MRIRCSNPATTKLYDSGIMDRPVYFVNGKAQVSDEVGRALAAKYSVIEVIETKRKKKTKSSKNSVTNFDALNGTITKADSEDVAGVTGTVVKDEDENISLTKDRPQEGD